MTYLMKAKTAHGMGDETWGSVLDAIIAKIKGTQPDPDDRVDQTASGTTTTASDFKNVGGVCKPMNFPALGAVQEFQRQLNRVAQIKKFSKIAVDGAVGPQTIALFRKVQAISNGNVMGDPSSCMGIAPDVDVLADQIRDLANALGAPAQVSGGLQIAPPSIVTKSNKVISAPASAGAAGLMGGSGGLETLAIVGVAGGIGYLLFFHKKGRR